MRAGHNRFRSRQDYVTPWPFIFAVERRFGWLDIDLAATKRNRRCKNYISRRQDSLKVPWVWHGNAWLNPPYCHIDPWVQKCACTRLNQKSNLIVLLPASIGSVWFRRWVFRKAAILSIGRLAFSRGKYQSMRDLMLCIYSHNDCLGLQTSFYLWDWKGDLILKP